MNTVISIDRLSRAFALSGETVTALDTVSIRLRLGELTVIAGPSGSGKTTLLTILAGYETHDTGTITTRAPLPDGVRPAGLGWRLSGFVPQTPTLLDELTVAENIELPARLDPDADRETPWDTDDLMQLLQIGHLADRYPRNTSGGEQQRTALARALRLGSTLVLADEPTGHQDRARVTMVLDVLRTYARAGHAVVITSHDDDVMTAADQLIRLHDGVIEATSEPVA